MDYKLLGLSILTAVREMSIIAAILLLLGYIVTHAPIWVTIGIAFLGFFGLYVSFEYDRRKNNARLEQLKKNFLSR